MSLICHFKNEKVVYILLFFVFQTVYDELFITLYNLMYTALPVLGMSLFDQVTISCVMPVPYLYV